MKNLVDKRIDPIMRPVAFKIGVCFMCMNNPGILTCNNVKDQDCKVCKECAYFCSSHGYHCRMHAKYYDHRAADRQVNQSSCELCTYESIKL